MGDFIHDSTTNQIFAQMSRRFDTEQLPEMIALQQEFKVFSPKHTLRQSFALLGIVPIDATERKGWYRFLDCLKIYKSDLPNVNGHDRMVKAIQQNLESKAPLPMAMICHAATDNLQLNVAQGTPYVFSADTHIVISIPTTPRGQARPRATGAAKPSRAAKSQK
jgi:hypothetical protein